MTFLCHCRLLRQGMHDLKVWADVEADGSPVTTTPGKTDVHSDSMSRIAKVSQLNAYNFINRAHVHFILYCDCQSLAESDIGFNILVNV